MPPPPQSHQAVYGPVPYPSSWCFGTTGNYVKATLTSYQYCNKGKGN